METNISTSRAEPEILSVSLGMVVIDEIHMPPDHTYTDVAGGSGCYATLGSRLFAGSSGATKVGCIVLAGDDFPAAVENQLRGWDVMIVLRKDSNKHSTRGLLEYEEGTFSQKKFRYTTKPLKASPKDLIGTPLLHAKAVHLLATPDEVRMIVAELQDLRTYHGISERPLIVWEPFPAACKQDYRQSFLDVCSLVDVFSPNHLEMAALFELEPNEFHRETLESYAQRFLECSVGPSGHGTVVIRAGTHGSLSVSRSIKPCWLPAYYQDGSSEVVDPTGAGNAFLGGYMIGWQLTKNVVEASCYGNIAASFALEQIGLPEREQKGEETWNGVSVVGRLHAYKERLDIII